MPSSSSIVWESQSKHQLVGVPNVCSGENKPGHYHLASIHRPQGQRLMNNNKVSSYTTTYDNYCQRASTAKYKSCQLNKFS